MQRAQIELDIVRNLAKNKKKMSENKTRQDDETTKKRNMPRRAGAEGGDQQHVQAIGLATSDGFYVVSKQVYVCSPPATAVNMESKINTSGKGIKPGF